MDPVWQILLQIFGAAFIIGGILFWLLRSLICQVQHEVESKVVLVTGCDTGIGHELAKHLDILGFQVFAGCLDTASEGAQRLRVEASTRLKLVNMDVRRDDHVDAAIHFIQENLLSEEEGLYAVVNNAGVCVCGEFDWQTWPQIYSQMEVNLVGTMRVVKKCLPLLKNAQGRIINVSSVAGLHGYPGLSVYCATKHALEGLSQVLRLELNKFGVNVITVQPGDFSKATHLLNSHHRNMNEMWGEMSDQSREEYKQFFIAYHDGISRSGFTGSRRKPISAIPDSVLAGFEQALLSKVPRKSYLLMPTLISRLKMIFLSSIPTSWAQGIISSRYKKSLPKIDITRSRSSLNTISY
jgi:3-hydroxybutyrate dehydrogenase